MPIISASPEERRRGGWLSRVEGRVKTKGLPIGPRPPSLKRILEGADDDSSPAGESGDVLGVRREVGSGRRNDARDVIAVKRALYDAGLYTMPCPTAPSPYFDSSLSLAIRIFKSRHGLTEDGVIRPGDLLLKAPDNANVARCQQLAVDIGNAELALASLRRQFDEANAQVKELADRVAETWANVRDSLIGPKMADIARNFWQLVRSRQILGRLGGLVGVVFGVRGIMAMVNEGYELEKEAETMMAARDDIAKRRDRKKDEIARLRAEQRRLRCP